LYWPLSVGARLELHFSMPLDDERVTDYAEYMLRLVSSNARRRLTMLHSIFPLVLPDAGATLAQRFLFAAANAGCTADTMSNVLVDLVPSAYLHRDAMIGAHVGDVLMEVLRHPCPENERKLEILRTLLTAWYDREDVSTCMYTVSTILWDAPPTCRAFVQQFEEMINTWYDERGYHVFSDECSSDPPTPTPAPLSSSSSSLSEEEFTLPW
jgi:hypothetical protein